MQIEKIVLIQPTHAGRIWGKAAGSPYTLMRVASIVPQEIPVEIWDENLGPLDFARLNSRTLVGISSMTLTIDRAKAIASKARRQGCKVAVGGLFVFGFDYDTIQVFEQTWRFIRETEFASVSLTVLTPYPATPQREQLITMGRLIPNVPLSHYDTTHVTFHPAPMTAE